MRGSCGQKDSLARQTLPFSRTWQGKEEWGETGGGNLREKAASRLPVLVSHRFQLFSHVSLQEPQLM